MTRPRAIFKQPLFYFALLGAIVFVIDGWLRKEPEQLEVDADVRSEVAAELTKRLTRAPTARELEEALTDWVETELLFREATALGLSQNDATIRSYLAKRLEQVVRDGVIVEPTEAELRAQLEANRERYVRLPSFDISHAFVLRSDIGTHQQRVEEALASLRGGADPSSVGDPFPRGHEFQRATRQRLEAIFDTVLSDALVADRLHAWQSVEARRGTHLIRVNAVHSGQPDIESSKAALTVDLRRQKQAEALERFMQGLREKYQVRGVELQ